MPLQDCVIATSTEVIDPTMVINGLSLSGSVIMQGRFIEAALSATWNASATPSAYVTGVQFEYLPNDGTSGRTISDARLSASIWVATDGIVAGKTYTVRYRPKGPPGVFGLWVGPSDVAISSPASPAPAQPGSSAWAATGTTITLNGVSFPAILVSGAIDTTGVTDIFIDVAPHNSSSFTPVDTFPIGTTSMTITEHLVSGGLYDVGISYVNAETVGTRRVLNNGGAGYTAGTFAGSGATTDVTPAAVNWTDQSASGTGTQTTTTNTQTISSINSPITLTLNYTNSASWSYIKNGGAAVSFSTGGTVTVVNGDTLAFTTSNGVTVTSVLTVVNTTDASTTLDTTTSTITVTSTDKTPDAVNWTDIFSDVVGAPQDSTNIQTITGINVPITLTISWTTVGTGSVLTTYSKNGAAGVTIASGGTISMSVNDALAFTMSRSGAIGEVSGVVTVANTTDGGATLDTFNYDLIREQSGSNR